MGLGDLRGPQEAARPSQPDRANTDRARDELTQERLTRATAVAKMFVWENDLRTGRQTWAGAAATVIGCSEADLRPEPEHSSFFVHPDDRDWILDQFADLVKSGGTHFSPEFRGVDGKIFRVDARVEYEASGAPVRVTGVTRDVTQEAEFRNSLSASEAQAHGRANELRAIYDAAPVGLCVLDRDLRFVRVNASLAAINGRPVDEHIGRHVSELVPDLLDIAGDKLDRVLKGEEFRGLELTAERPDGTFSYRVNWVPLWNADREVDGIFISVENVTQERRAARSLAERDLLLEAVGASSPDLIYAKDREGRLLYANPATVAAMRLTGKDVLGRTSVDLLPLSGGPDQLRNDMRVIETGKTVTADERLDFPGGQSVIYQTTKAPLRDGQGAIIGLVGVSQDVTERRAAEARQAFLLHLGDRLRADRRAASVTGEELGRFFGVSRAGCSSADCCGEWLDVTAEWTDGSVPRATSRQELASLGAWLRDDLRQGRTVVIEDVTQDPRITDPAPFLAIDTRSAISVPILRDGRLVSTTYLNHKLPRAWTQAEVALVTEVAARSWAAVERERTEASLRIAEERHRKVLEASAAVVWSTDSAGQFVEPQLTWQVYTGQAWPDHAGHGWVKKVHPDDRHRLLEAWNDAYRTGTTYQSEGRLWHQATRGWRRFVVRGTRLASATSQGAGWIGAITDVEDLRQAERKFGASEVRLRLAKESAGLGIFELDTASGALDWDDASLRLLRQTERGIPDLTALLRTVHPDDRAPVQHAIERAREGAGHGRMSVDCRILIPHKEPVWLAMTAQSISGPDGEQRLVGTLRDITDRKQNELALQALNSQLEARVEETLTERNRIWSITDDLLVVGDFSGRICEISDSCVRVLGRTRDEVMSRHFIDFVHPDDAERVMATIGVLQREGGSVTFEDRVRHADGSWKLIAWRLTHEMGSDRVFGVGRDITAQRARDETLAATQAQLHEAQKLETIGQLTGGVAHDFNNVLAAVMSTLRIVQKRTEDARALTLVEGALQAAERGALLVERLLAFARRQELKAEVISLPVMLDGIRDLVSQSLGPKITVQEQVPADLPHILVDANQLELALLNLAVNSRDAMPDGGTVEISARSATADESMLDLKPGRYVVLSVRDTGIGMTEEVRKRATEPFFTTKGIGKGTGLGLSMVHGLAAQSGGAMQLDSTPGVGTRVSLWLPESPLQASASAPMLARDDAKDRPRRSLKVLVVDDDALVAMGTAAILEDLGHAAIEAHSGARALDHLAADPQIDLVITDHSMPQMTGVELAEAIRQRRPDLPVVLASGYADLPNGRSTDLPRLPKPYGISQMADMIETLFS